MSIFILVIIFGLVIFAAIFSIYFIGIKLDDQENTDLEEDHND